MEGLEPRACARVSYFSPIFALITANGCTALSDRLDYLVGFIHKTRNGYSAKPDQRLNNRAAKVPHATRGEGSQRGFDVTHTVSLSDDRPSCAILSHCFASQSSSSCERRRRRSTRFRDPRAQHASRSSAREVSNATRATRASAPEGAITYIHVLRARMQRREPRGAARTAPTTRIPNVIRRPSGSSPCTRVHVDLSRARARARALRNTSPRGSTMKNRARQLRSPSPFPPRADTYRRTCITPTPRRTRHATSARRSAGNPEGVLALLTH